MGRELSTKIRSRSGSGEKNRGYPNILGFRVQPKGLQPWHVNFYNMSVSWTNEVTFTSLSGEFGCMVFVWLLISLKIGETGGGGEINGICSCCLSSKCQCFHIYVTVRNITSKKIFLEDCCDDFYINYDRIWELCITRIYWLALISRQVIAA